MSASGHEMLRALGGGLRPQGLPGGATARPASESLDFQAMLESARAGDLSSGRRVAPGSGVEADISGEVATALSAAADEAEAAGAARLFALVDERGYEIDVPTRTIKRTVNAPDLDRVQVGIDALYVRRAMNTDSEAGDDAVAQDVLTSRPPTEATPPAALLDVLSSAERGGTSVG